MNPYSAAGILRKYETLEDFLNLVSLETGISVKNIKTNKRYEKIVLARHIYCYLSRKYTRFPLTRIGELINRHHSSVVNSIGVVADTLAVDEDFESKMHQVEDLIGKQPVNEITVHKKKRHVKTETKEEKLVPIFQRPKAEYSNRQY